MANLLNGFLGGVKSVDGQVTVNLNLTIKIEADGSLSVAPMIGQQQIAEKVLEKVENKEEETKFKYEIPDFGFGEDNIIDFGKNVGD